MGRERANAHVLLSFTSTLSAKGKVGCKPSFLNTKIKRAKEKIELEEGFALLEKRKG